MKYTDAEVRRKVRLIEQHTADLAKHTPTDAALADAVGHVRAVEVSLAATRHRWEALVHEMEPVPEPQGQRVNPHERAGAPQVEGRDYELVKQFKIVRSYNTPAIITSLAAATGRGPTDALMDAVGAGACKLTWQWTKMKAYLADVEAELRVVYHEVADHSGLDDGMVGEQKLPNGVKRVALVREGE